MNLRKFKRDFVKTLLKPWLNWPPFGEVHDGFSIILGVPWALRHLLPVNLEFVLRTDISSLHRLHIVFDKVEQKGGGEFVSSIRENFPNLPLSFYFHPPVVGRLVEYINQSKFYASMNWTIGISRCSTRFAILHDFDLYPLRSNYFTDMVAALRCNGLRFTGLELTHFDGLQDFHNLIGTWALGIDVAWLRNHFRPVDCFHAVERIGDRYFDLDAFTHIESKTPQRALVGTMSPKDVVHVKNLCSTHLRLNKGEKVAVAWRLHMLWYLESLCGQDQRLGQVVGAMENSVSSILCIDNRTVDFSSTHVTCANVLRGELFKMESFLLGRVRPEVINFTDSFESFLWKFGQSFQLIGNKGEIIWQPSDGVRNSQKK